MGALRSHNPWAILAEQRKLELQAIHEAARKTVGSTSITEEIKMRDAKTGPYAPKLPPKPTVNRTVRHVDAGDDVLDTAVAVGMGAMIGGMF